MCERCPAWVNTTFPGADGPGPLTAARKSQRSPSLVLSVEVDDVTPGSARFCPTPEPEGTCYGLLSETISQISHKETRPGQTFGDVARPDNGCAGSAGATSLVARPIQPTTKTRWICGAVRKDHEIINAFISVLESVVRCRTKMDKVKAPLFLAYLLDQSWRVWADFVFGWLVRTLQSIYLDNLDRQWTYSLPFFNHRLRACLSGALQHAATVQCISMFSLMACWPH